MAKASLGHHAVCSTCKKALAWLDARMLEHREREDRSIVNTEIGPSERSSPPDPHPLARARRFTPT